VNLYFNKQWLNYHVTARYATSNIRHWIEKFVSSQINNVPVCCETKLMCQWTVSRPGWPAVSPLTHTARTDCHIYTSLPPDDGLLASLEHVAVQ
jgi:hypothetical protein